MKYRRLLFFVLICFLSFNVVSAQELDLYFNLNGGAVQTSGFEYDEEFGFLHYHSNYYASYKGGGSIQNINSISGVKFDAIKSGTSLVKGREWYVKDESEGKTYYFSQSKKYKVKEIFQVFSYEDDPLLSLDVYANWSDNPVKGGVDFSATGGEKTTSPKSFKISSSSKTVEVGKELTLKTTFTPKDTSDSISWSSSNQKIAIVDIDGVVTGVKKGTVTITGKTSGGLKSTIKIEVKEATVHYTNIKFHMNGGSLAKKHGSNFTVSNDIVLYKKNQIIHKIPYDESLSKNGLINPDNPDCLNIEKIGYVVVPGEEWNTKKDGTGTSYSDENLYRASDFCDSSKKDCTITLYAHWKVDENAEITLSESEIKLKVDKSKELLATGVVRGSTEGVTWSSSDPTIASVTNGKVVANKVGKAVITVKTANGSIATCDVIVVGDAKVKELGIQDALKFCDENNVTKNGGCKKYTYKLPHGAQSVDTTSDGKYLFFLTPDGSSSAETYDEPPVTLRIYKKNSDGSYHFYKKHTGLALGHANGMTYYKSSDGGNQLLIATNLKEGDGHPLLVRYRLYLSESNSKTGAIKKNYTSLQFYPDPGNVLENATQTVISVAAKPSGGFYIVAKQGAYKSQDLSSLSIVNYYSSLESAPTVFRRSEFNPYPNNDAYWGTITINQDITYHNGKIYAVYYNSSDGCHETLKKYYNLNDCKAYENYISIYNEDGSFDKIRTLKEPTISAKIKEIDNANYGSSVKRRIKEMQEVVFINGESYVVIQKSKSEIVGTYLLRVTGL